MSSIRSRSSSPSFSNSLSIVWFRLDLRLADNPALQAAIKTGGPVIPVFIYAPHEEDPWAPGGASRWWLHQSIQALDKSLRETGSRVILRKGPSLHSLQTLVKETGTTAVFWNRRYEPALSARDAVIEKALLSNGVKVETFNSALVHEPWTIQNQSGKPFQVFTPFWKHCLARTNPDQPLPPPPRIPSPRKWPGSLELKSLKLEPEIDWASGIRAAWNPGEAGAKTQLARFLKSAFAHYPKNRDHPGVSGTSRLSPYLHFGEISPRQIWHSIRRHAEKEGVDSSMWRSGRFVTELGWREFSHHLLYHFPHTHSEPLRPQFKRFRWHHDSRLLKAWQKGQTGYPIVDAGMRELWTTGWMHNRVRMIVASFLVKDLLLSWTEGARWFWDTLVDADLAQNTLGWQWTAGCGADAAPYFRVFNPVSQGEKFDATGDYIRRWCPELQELGAKWLHKPWEAPRDILADAQVRLGKDYPEPIVNHSTAREVALEAFARIKQTG